MQSIYDVLNEMVFASFHVDWSQQETNCVTADQRMGYCNIADDDCCLIDSICMHDSRYQG